MSVRVLSVSELANLADALLGTCMTPSRAASILARYSEANAACLRFSYAHNPSILAEWGKAHTFEAIMEALGSREPQLLEAQESFLALHYNLISNEGRSFAAPELLTDLIAVGEALSAAMGRYIKSLAA